MGDAPWFLLATIDQARRAWMGLLVAIVATLGLGAPGGGTALAADEPFLLSPPPADGPVVVRASFRLHDVNAIDEQNEVFEFSGVLTLEWNDPRQRFDPAEAGVTEKAYQGNFQFNESSPAWYPQAVLVNESGLFAQNGVVLRARADGRQTLVTTVNAAAKTDLNMRRFPFDWHRLEAVFEVLGFDDTEVVLEAAPDKDRADGSARLPQWRIIDVHQETRTRDAPYAGSNGRASAFVVTIDAKRRPFYMIRLVLAPLGLIVLLSFSVFWMDRASLGDRLSVSFIGLLTAVAYLTMLTDLLPRISYMTLMHGLINFSFFIMCATVVVNVVVSVLGQRGKSDVGDRIDRRSRWIFPLVYFALGATAFVISFVFF